jgi:hypothetical protein
MMLTTDHSIPVHGGTRLRRYLLAVAALLVALDLRQLGAAI